MPQMLCLGNDSILHIITSYSPTDLPYALVYVEYLFVHIEKYEVCTGLQIIKCQNHWIKISYPLYLPLIMWQGTVNMKSLWVTIW